MGLRAGHGVQGLRAVPWDQLPTPPSIPCRRDILRSWHPSPDPQPGRAALHPSAGLRRLAWLPDLCVLPGAAGKAGSGAGHMGPSRGDSGVVPFPGVPLRPTRPQPLPGGGDTPQPRGCPSPVRPCSDALPPRQLTYLPQPWGNCRASVQGEQTLPGYDTYSIAACRLQCEKEAVVRSCHCRMVHMPGEGPVRPCTQGSPPPHRSAPATP